MRIGSYEIAEQIGAGGMGEVYRATDTSLARHVAIKVLPEAVAADAERLARFDREAKTLAALNHPNIAQIHGLERTDGQTALVMELVEGPTLADRIIGGALPVDEALPIARQITEALEAAHARGIVHRDLKPANVKVRPDGTVKVLDFGLAKAIEPASAQSASAGQAQTFSPTITTPAHTMQGAILGTAAYMSPEQARGKPTDRRTDIWAFGCVLFEMLTGSRAFEGEDVADTLGNVMKLEPGWERLPASVPARVERVLRACLQKKVTDRLDSAQDVRLALDGAFETAASPVAEPSAASLPVWQRPLPVAAVALLIGGILVGAVWALWPPAPLDVSRFSHRIPATHALRRIGRPVLAVSPDGRHVAYNSQTGVYLRAMDTLETRLVPGTEGDLAGPFFSPDGQEIAYFEVAAQQLKRVGISGGAPVVISDVDAMPSGAHWATDGTILFAQPSGIARVPARGGEPQVVIPAGEGERFYGPQLLPDGDGVLFSVTTASGSTAWDEGQIVVASLSTGQRTVIVEGGTEGRVLPTGHLVYALGNDLLAVAFDVATLTTSGGSVSLVQGVRRSPQGGATGAADYGVTAQGTLVYLTGEAVGAEGLVLIWADEDGNLTRAVAGSRAYDGVRLSPDGQSLAVVEDAAEGDQVWIIDLESGTRDLLAEDVTVKRNPVWTPDGLRVTFRSGEDIVWRLADGSEPVETVWDGDAPAGPLDWSPDGQTLLFQAGPEGDFDLWTYSLADDMATPFQVGPELQTDGRFSPDGNWIAFIQSGSPGNREVWVAPFPGPGTPRQVSTEDHGGDQAVWSPDGQRLYYRGFSGGITGELLVSQVDMAGGFRRTEPEPMWDVNLQLTLLDIHADGPRFLLGALPDAFTETERAGDDLEIVFVQNWLEELTRNVPTD